MRKMENKIQEKLLTVVEREEYHRFDSVHGLSSREQMDIPGMWAKLGVFTMFGAGLAILGVTGFEWAATEPRPTLAAMICVFVLAFVAWSVWGCWVVYDANMRNLEMRRAAFLKSIGYEARLREQEERMTRQYDDDAQTPRGRSAQRIWYGRHSGLDFRDRRTAEALGIDSDTYVDNFLGD